MPEKRPAEKIKDLCVELRKSSTNLLVQEAAAKIEKLADTIDARGRNDGSRLSKHHKTKAPAK